MIRLDNEKGKNLSVGTSMEACLGEWWKERTNVLGRWSHNGLWILAYRVEMFCTLELLVVFYMWKP